MKVTLALGALAVAVASTSAHGPTTKEEVAAYHARQESAYHCAPAVAAYTAARKRSFAQKVLGGDPTAHKNLFIDSYFDDNSLPSRTGSAGASETDLNETERNTLNSAAESAHARGKRLMECNPVVHTAIRNHTCVLAPEVTEGPYYHSEGHPIRSNMAEWELGLLFMMNVGVIDVETCKPIPNILVDLWHANATGYYAGHPDPKPELADEQPAASGRRKGLLSAYPRTKFEETWLRGALPTDENGIAEFTSIFPGYYTGRATHVHAKIFPEWETLPNGTFRQGRLAHTGQFFVDDILNEQIDKLWPYNTNPIRHLPGRGRTRNWEDSLQIFDEAHDGGYSPTFEIEPLGGVLTQGLIGYITVAINASAAYEAVWNPQSGKAGPGAKVQSKVN